MHVFCRNDCTVNYARAFRGVSSDDVHNNTAGALIMSGTGAPNRIWNLFGWNAAITSATRHGFITIAESVNSSHAVHPNNSPRRHGPKNRRGNDARRRRRKHDSSRTCVRKQLGGKERHVAVAACTCSTETGHDTYAHGCRCRVVDSGRQGVCCTFTAMQWYRCNLGALTNADSTECACRLGQRKYILTRPIMPPPAARIHKSASQ